MPPSCAVNSLCEPFSATRPPDSTKMISEFCTVLKRWAMLTIVILPAVVFPRLSMVRWIIFSERLSKALVASSKNSSEGFLSRARAMAMRCFWPPENCDPPEPT
mmetsp:Transcript_63926/g.149871  ORF Transcript_63926/g.149871 Transcript_63926/m.149871 type:complete len:104 (+) Transcript_63926:17-328(+)